MKKSILEIYALAVCFVTVVCAVISLGIGIYDILEITNPEFTLPSYQYERHQTNEAFFRKDCGKEDKDLASLSEGEKTKRRLESLEVALKAERRGGVQSIVKAFIVLIVDTIAFIIHWWVARRARESGIVY